MAFIEKSFEGYIPAGHIDQKWSQKTECLYEESGELIEKGHLKDAIELIFAYVRQANKYFDEQRPWVQVKEDKESCGQTLHTCVQIIANIAQLLNPFLPFACEKIRTFLTLEQPSWRLISVPAGRKVRDLKLLFTRMDLGRIDEEVSRLAKQTYDKQ